MRITPKMPLLLAFALFMVLATVDAAQRPVSAQCETVTDEQLVQEVYTRLKAEKSIAPQLSHINVISVNRVVKLQGWTDDKSDHQLVLRIVAGIKCVVMINTQLFEEAPPAESSPLRPDGGSCGPGTKPCGDVCIPEADSCNISPGQTKG